MTVTLVWQLECDMCGWQAEQRNVNYDMLKAWMQDNGWWRNYYDNDFRLNETFCPRCAPKAIKLRREFMREDNTTRVQVLERMRHGPQDD